MSISAATNVAFSRRADIRVPNPRNLPELEAATGGAPDAKNTVTSALSAIATYIPSEILTVYVAVLAAIQTSNANGNKLPSATEAAWIALWFFFLATPIVVWVLYATKVRSAGKPLPKAPKAWPVWEMASATIAFLAWAFAMPNTPFAEMRDWYSAPLAGIIVLVLSAALGLVAPLFTQRPLP